MISVPEPKLARVADKGLNLQINIGVSDYGINIYRLYFFNTQECLTVDLTRVVVFAA